MINFTGTLQYMKKIPFILFICMLLSAASRAQLSSFNLDAGIKLGVNLNKVEGEYWDNGYKANLMGGIYIALNTNRWGVQVEPLFTQSTFSTGKGFNDLYKDFYQTGKDSVVNGTFRVNYYNIPILLNLKMFNRVWIQLGPQFSGTLSVNDPDNLMTDAEAFLKNSMLSLVGGLWIKLPAHLTLSGRYVMGVNNLNSQSNYIQHSRNVKDNWNQRLLQIGIGYTFF